MRRNLLWLCLLTLPAARASAQAPHIDHLAIDDPTGRLTIFGSFGWTPGIVTIDSVLTPWSFWSEDSIVCTIPDSGRGSCGPVRANTSGYMSNDKLVSAWYLVDNFEYDGHGPEHNFSALHIELQFRLDLAEAILHPSTSALHLSSTSTSSIHQSGGSSPDPGTTNDPYAWAEYDTTDQGPIDLSFDLSSRSIQIAPVGVQHFWRAPNYDLSEAFQVPGGSNNYIPLDGGWGKANWGQSKLAAFIPPDSLLHQVAAVRQDSRPQTKRLEILYATTSGCQARFDPVAHARTLKISDAVGKIVASYSIAEGVIETVFSLRFQPGIYVAVLEGETSKFVILP